MSRASEPLFKLKGNADSEVPVHEQPEVCNRPQSSIETHASRLSHLRNVIGVKVHSKARDQREGQVTVKPMYLNLSVKKHALSFTIDTLHDDEEPWQVEWMMFNILNDFLQPNTKLSVDEAANCLDAILPDNRPDTPDDPDDERERAENWLWTFGEIIWKFAVQIPHNHESQDKILHLLQALDRLPFTQTFDEKHFWALKLFGWEDPSRWAVADSKPRKKPQESETCQQKCDAYINAMAFAARCAAIDWPHYDLILGTIDEPLNPACAVESCHDMEPEFMYVHVAAAAQWILHAGEWLWRQIRWGKNQGLGSTKRSLPPAQWVLWMRGYYRINTDNQEVRFWADALVSKMEQIMIAHGYTTEAMMTWDPQEQTVHDRIREDSRYAHLFRIPKKSGE